MVLDEFLEFLARCSLLVKKSVEYFGRWLTDVFLPRVAEGTPSLKLEALRRLAAEVKEDDEFGFIEEKIDHAADARGEGPDQKGRSNVGIGVTRDGVDTHATLMHAWGGASTQQ